MDNYQRGFLHGVIFGVVIVVGLWILFAFKTEKSKVDNGYLTFRSATYSVALYNTLKKPVKDETK